MIIFQNQNKTKIENSTKKVEFVEKNCRKLKDFFEKNSFI
jgi:hypothetical protein